ncbi:MAG: pyridoxal phosphate-dependent aminotransferase [Pirellulaceae bacterium]
MHAIAQRIQNVQDPVIPIVGKLIAENPGTISLGQGIVHYPAPEHVNKAMLSAFAVGSESQSSEGKHPAFHQYGDVCGSPELLSRIRDKVRSENSIDVSHSSIVYTAGSNMGFLNAVLAIADVGDEVVLPSPFYFNHDMAIEVAGCKTITVPTTSEYQLDISALEAAITTRTKAIVTVSPNNPTGAVYPQADLIAVNQLCARNGIYHISDEAYEYFLYDGLQHFSPASIDGSTDHTISLFTLSKAYGMAGWRCGYMVAPEHLLMPIKKIQDTNLVCPPMLNQLAAEAALEAGVSWCNEQSQGYSEVRKTILRELGTLPGCTIPNPQGAFYMLLKLDSDLSAMEIVRKLIEQYGVATLPGTTFGVTDECAIRVSYGALERESVLAGVQRLKSGLQSLLH